MRQVQRSMALAGTCLLAACGLVACGGGSSSGSSGSASGAPPPTTFTIGGSVSGLTASGLVLLNNGGNALSVPANTTTFTFSTSVASGTAYAITIQTQPTGEHCTVVNGSGMASADVASVGVSCGNSVGMSVVAGPASSGYQTFNIPLTSVTVCVPSSNQCATIQNVLVDTGSTGLRLMASVLAATGLTLPTMSDPNAAGNTIHECVQFADGYTWGPVATAGVVMGGETTSSPVAVQIIDDSQTPSPAAPTGVDGCVSGTSLNSVNAFDANGVLGVGVFDQDCGTDCTQGAAHVYYSCTSSGSCASTTLAIADQVTNPVAAFASDNNGVVLQLPSIPAAGQASASGTLTFGVGTESNNGLGTATLLTADNLGNISTSFGGLTYPDSLLDSGSNALYFADSTLAASPCPQGSGGSLFYCPGTTQDLSATNQGANGNTTPVSFQIADLAQISSSNFAINDVGGPMTSGYFDWGLPFFYNQTVFILLENTTNGGTYGAYAY